MDGIELELTVNIRLVPFETSDTDFYVFLDNQDGNNLVAAIERVNGGWVANQGTTVYNSAIMAAFADANLADPASWIED